MKCIVTVAEQEGRTMGTRLRVAVAAIGLATVVCLLPSTEAAHAQGVPGVEKNKCLAGKSKCVSKKLAGLLKCREKCQKSPLRCGQAQTDCETRVMAKFDGGAEPAKGCFAKLEAKANPAKPDSVCTTTGDAAAMEAEVDAIAADLLAKLEGIPAPTCGDGVVNLAGEHCDGADLGGASCASISHPPGSLGCDSSCRFDATLCDCPSGGAPVAGGCWFAAAQGKSCSEACANQGLAYDDATRDSAGSGGTDANCGAVVRALFSPLLPPAAIPLSCPAGAGLGCFQTLVRGVPYRCVSPETTAEAAEDFIDIMDGFADDFVTRACACL